MRIRQLLCVAAALGLTFGFGPAASGAPLPWDTGISEVATQAYQPTGVQQGARPPGLAAQDLGTTPAQTPMVYQGDTNHTDTVMDGGQSHTLPTQVYLIFWGSGWGNATTDSNNDLQLSGDYAQVAGRAQEFFKAIGTPGDTWSQTVSQYCDGPGVPHNATAGAACNPSTNGVYMIPRQTNVFQGYTAPNTHVMFDNSDPNFSELAGLNPGTMGQSASLQAELTKAHNKFNASDATSYYAILFPPGVNLFNYEFSGTGAAHNTDSTGTRFFSAQAYTPDRGFYGVDNVGRGISGMSDGYVVKLGHEWAEALTNKRGAYGWQTTPTTEGEIGDICAGAGNDQGHGESIDQATSFGAAGTFPTQALYSDLDNRCVWSYNPNAASLSGRTGTPNHPANVVGIPSDPVQGTITVSVSGADNTNTAQVLYKIDGQGSVDTSGSNWNISDAAANNFSLAINTKALPDGQHTIQAFAMNFGGTMEQTGSVPITFTTYNTPVYALSTDKSQILKWDGVGTQASDWTALPGGGAAQLYSGEFGLFKSDSTGVLSWWDEVHNTWTQISGPGTGEVRVTATHLYFLPAGQNGVYEWIAGHAATSINDTSAWNSIGGNVKDIFGGGNGLFATDQNGAPMQWMNSVAGWSYVVSSSDRAVSVAVTGDAVEHIGTDNQVHWSNYSTYNSWLNFPTWADNTDIDDSTKFTGTFGTFSKIYGNDQRLLAVDTNGNMRLEYYSTSPITNYSIPSGSLNQTDLTQGGLYGLNASGNVVHFSESSSTRNTLVPLGIAASQVA